MDPKSPRHSLPIISRTIQFNSPRSVLLLNPVVPLVIALFFIAVTFTIWPSALEHAPISFEKRGVVHHIWHYSLLGGSVLAIYGMFSANMRRLQFEFAGLLLLVTAMAMNLVAQVSLFADQGPAAVADGVTGFGLGLRAGVLATLLLRLVVLYFEPVVQVSGPTLDNGEE